MLTNRETQIVESCFVSGGHTIMRSDTTRPEDILKIICPLQGGRVLVEKRSMHGLTQLRNVSAHQVPDGAWMNWRLARINDDRVAKALAR